MSRGGIGYRRNIPDHKIISRCNRLNNPTHAESIVWEELKRLRSLGFIFRRERLVYGWCLDFYCAKRRLAIEVDGPYHLQRKSEDAKRDWLLSQKQSIQTLRFTNEQVIKDLPGTMIRILAIVELRPIFRSWNQKKSIPGQQKTADPGAHEHRAVPLTGKAATVATNSRAT